jgi:pimeloyl-ACP methyl ester carboxylesterase
MRRSEAILAIAGISLLLLGTSFIRRSSLPRQDTVIVAGGCHTPATILEPPAGVNAMGAAILLHGLGANRRTMMYLGTDFAGHGFRTYLLDLPGHGDNTDRFAFAKAEQCADATVESLMRAGQAAGQIDPKKTIVLGHSMGGAIAIRMADRNPVAATIAISPAPMVLPRRMPPNLLVFVGQYDLWPMKRQASELAAAAGGQRIRPGDFAEDRAFKLQVVAHATHTSPVISQEVAHGSEDWAMQALFPTVQAKTRALNLDLATYDTFNQGRRRLAGAVLGLWGLVFLLPASAAFVGAIASPRQAAPESAHPSPVLVVAQEAVCALGSVLILALVVPLRFLRLYDGDYLASLLWISGTLLLILNRRVAKQNLSIDGKALGAASVAGIAVILAVGAWFNWQLGDLWMNGPRWVRFAALLPVTWIFCFSEEVLLGPVGAGKQRALRFALFLIMRLELWLACVLGYYSLANGQALIGVLVTGLAVFSILQRAVTDALRRRTGSATAAAVFGAILAAWFIAAVFPLA